MPLRRQAAVLVSRQPEASNFWQPASAWTRPDPERAEAILYCRDTVLRVCVLPDPQPADLRGVYGVAVAVSPLGLPAIMGC